jgi:hypothetical protein
MRPVLPPACGMAYVVEIRGGDASGLWDGLCGGDKRWRGGWQRAILGRAGHSKAVRTLPVGEVGGGEDPQGGGGTRGGCGRCNTR